LKLPIQHFRQHFQFLCIYMTVCSDYLYYTNKLKQVKPLLPCDNFSTPQFQWHASVLGCRMPAHVQTVMPMWNISVPSCSHDAHHSPLHIQHKQWYLHCNKKLALPQCQGKPIVFSVNDLIWSYQWVAGLDQPRRPRPQVGSIRPSQRDSSVYWELGQGRCCIMSPVGPSLCRPIGHFSCWLCLEGTLHHVPPIHVTNLGGVSRCSAAQLLLAICVWCMLSCPKTDRSRRRVFV